MHSQTITDSSSLHTRYSPMLLPAPHGVRCPQCAGTFLGFQQGEERTIEGPVCRQLGSILNLSTISFSMRLNLGSRPFFGSQSTAHLWTARWHWSQGQWGQQQQTGPPGGQALTKVLPWSSFLISAAKDQWKHGMISGYLNFPSIYVPVCVTSALWKAANVFLFVGEHTPEGGHDCVCWSYCGYNSSK